MSQHQNRWGESERAGGTVVNPVLRDASVGELERASELLRERTMTLERPDGIAGKGAVAVLISLAICAVVLTFKFRTEIKVFLGLS